MEIIKLLMGFALAQGLYAVLPLPSKTSLSTLYSRALGRHRGAYILDDPEKEERLMAYEASLMKLNKFYIFILTLFSVLFINYMF